MTIYLTRRKVTIKRGINQILFRKIQSRGYNFAKNKKPNPFTLNIIED